MIKTSVKTCITCKYCKFFNSEKQNHSRYCDYLCMTNRRRDCPVGLCDKYEKKSRRK